MNFEFVSNKSNFLNHTLRTIPVSIKNLEPGLLFHRHNYRFGHQILLKSLPSKTIKMREEDYSPLPKFPSQMVGKVTIGDHIRDPCLPDFRAFIECCREVIHVSLCEKESIALMQCRGMHPCTNPKGKWHMGSLGK